MSITGKNAVSIRKQDLLESRPLANGFTKLVFAHKAVLGESGIDLGSLVVPPEMSALGFTNPSPARLLEARLFQFKANVSVESSLRGILIQDLSYLISSNSRINFQGFTAEEGEIFRVTVDSNPANGIQVIDAKTPVVEGELAASTTDFAIGFSTPTNSDDILVFRNGLEQRRNTNNSDLVLDGNYYVVDSGNGFGNVVRFNNPPAGTPDYIKVTAIGGVVESPTDSTFDEIQKVQGQIDAIVPDLAQALGNPETDYQAAPNNVDLKQFGARVLDLESDLSDLISRLERTRFHIGSVSTTAESSLTNTSFSQRNVNITFTPQFTGLYKVSSKASFQINQAGTRVIGQVQNTAGGVSITNTMEALLSADGSGVGDEHTQFPWSTFILTAGVSYTFALFSRAPAGGTYSHIPGNNDNGSRMWAEYMGPVED